MVSYFSLGTLPPTLNEITDTARRNRFKSAAVKKQWTEYVATHCKSLSKLKHETAVHLECVWFIKNFSRDHDNIEASAKYLMDGIVAAGCLKDDSLRIVKSPIIHWFNKVENHDSLVFIFYTPKEWAKRQKLGIVQPVVTQPEKEIPNFSTKPLERPKKPKRRRCPTTSLAAAASYYKKN